MKSVLFWFFLNIILLFFTLVTGPERTIKHILRWDKGEEEKNAEVFSSTLRGMNPTVNNRPLYDEPNYDIIQIA